MKRKGTANRYNGLFYLLNLNIDLTRDYFAPNASSGSKEVAVTIAAH